MNALWNAYSAQMQENMNIMGKWWSCIQQNPPRSYEPEKEGLNREKVYEDNQAILHRYSSQKDSKQIPVLVVYALVNKTYLLDLAPNRSFIGGLLKSGTDVYLIEWKDPEVTRQTPTLEDYIQVSIDSSVNWICKEHDLSSINLLGICQGGVFSLIYTSLYQEKIKNLVTMVTPIDFHAGNNPFTSVAKYCDTRQMNEMMKVIPGDLLNFSFLQIKPFSLMIGKYLSLYDIVDNSDKMDMFLRMEKWIFDNPGQSGPAWDKFVHDCYQENKLIQKQMTLGKEKIDLSKITCPFLSITAEKDHVVPTECSKPIANAISSTDFTHASFPVGHIGVFVSKTAEQKVIPKILHWLDERKS